jgi:hypothetical protein
MTCPIARGLAAALLRGASGLAAATGFCRMLYLYATNARAACEQYGVSGLSGLYIDNLFVLNLTHLHGGVPVASR